MTDLTYPISTPALKKIWKSQKRRLQDTGIEDNSDGEQENNTDPIGNTKQVLSKIEYQFAYITGAGALLHEFFSEAVVRKCQKGVLCNFIRKETLVQVFSREFCEISKNTFLTELLRWLLLLIGMDQQLTAVVEITGRSSVITGQFPI